MSLKDVKINRCYETDGNKNTLLESFYIPVLKEAKEYARMTGYFNSASLSIAFEGVEQIVENGGRIKLLVGPELTDEDFQIVQSHSFEMDENLSIFKEFDFSSINSNDNLKILSWLLTNNLLEIKIVLNKLSRNSIFHEKIGIVEDNLGNQISFSGSINETPSGWLGNIEEFKVFRSWELVEDHYFNNDKMKFNSYWENKKTDIAEVCELPAAIKKEIISHAPQNIDDIIAAKKFLRTCGSNDLFLNSLFEHQLRAISAWENNNKRLLIEMATGTGKTRTAIGAMHKLKKENRKLLVIISTPQSILSKQWKLDVDNLNISFDRSKIIDGTNSNWRNDLSLGLTDLEIDIIQTLVVYTTHTTSSSDDFIKIIKSNNWSFDILFICDEVHGIATETQKKALLDEYKYCIGLSATPTRMFDPSGTKLIREYFGGKSFEFTIHDALNTINKLTQKPFLNNFLYYPRFVELNEEEEKEYKKLSRKIAVIYDDEEKSDELEKLLITRSKILKNCRNKIDELKNIIDELKCKGRIQDMIVFVSDKQITEAMELLAINKLSRAKITEDESASKIVYKNLSERAKYIDDFKKGNIQVLLGMKCLDEGIDIPNAKIAVLMASSINSREYVQRVGRVIRYSPNKDVSVIYDMLVLPKKNETTDSTEFYDKEFRRALSIASNALNYNEVKNEFEKMGVDTQCLLVKK